MVGDGQFGNASSEGDDSVKSFMSQPLQKTLMPNTLTLGPENTGLPGAMAWMPSLYGHVSLL